MTFRFTVTHEDPHSRGRTGYFETPHGRVETPVFMPVGTKATVKGMTPEEVEHLGARIVLANTFHLLLRPGDSVIRDLGGLHRFMNWNRPILTDSGGFQVFSLARLNKVAEEGVHFQSPLDGERIFLTPEKAITIQENLGADIIMCFDECVAYPADAGRVQASAELTARWAERCKGAHRRSDQALFGIVQGGVYPEIRQWSARATVDIGFPGYAIGGLSVGETKPELKTALEVMDTELPRECPRYLMGVGTPGDFFTAVEQGVDMFDCVLPTRTARNGRLFTYEGPLNIRNAEHTSAPQPVSSSCPCYVCRNYSRAYLRHLFMANEILASRLATWHNLHFFLDLMLQIRNALRLGHLNALRERVMQGYVRLSGT
jgi:queuine tRNA-ribosyltransferase